MEYIIDAVPIRKKINMDEINIIKDRIKYTIRIYCIKE